MFKFPYSNFNETNLDWIMKTVHSLEPAVDMVEQATAALQQANDTSAEALRVANEADNAVATVTSQAAYAVQTADDAKSIAQQAASATIADGSITESKLGSDVIDRFEADETAIQNNASNIQTVDTKAGNAISAAGTAQTMANQASAAAAEALSKAEQALSQATGSGPWILAGNSVGSAVAVPTGAKELLILAYITGYGTYKASTVVPVNAIPAGGCLIQIPIAVSQGSINMCGVWCTPTSTSPHNTAPTIGCYYQLFYR